MSTESLVEHAKARVEIVNEINAKAATAEAARARVQKAKSEMGTAERELERVERELATLSARLQKLLPAPARPTEGA